MLPHTAVIPYATLLWSQLFANQRLSHARWYVHRLVVLCSTIVWYYSGCLKTSIALIMQTYLMLFTQCRDLLQGQLFAKQR